MIDADQHGTRTGLPNSSGAINPSICYMRERGVTSGPICEVYWAWSDPALLFREGGSAQDDVYRVGF